METNFVGLSSMPFSQNQVRREFRHDLVFSNICEVQKDTSTNNTTQ